MESRGKKLLIAIWIILTIVILAAIFYFFIYAETCKDDECFLNSLRECRRAKYISGSQGNEWGYSIQNPFGFWQNKCFVKVNSIKIASEEELAKKLEGKSMQCKIPRAYAGTFIQIHSELEFCSGPLKEGLQDLLVDKLYNFIILNIGELTEEIRSVGR